MAKTLPRDAQPEMAGAVTLDDWQGLGIVCGALLALFALIGVIDRKVVRPVWRSLKNAARLLEQLTGDKDRGVKSLMEQLGELADGQLKQGKQLAEHLEWHSSPGGQPAQQVVRVDRDNAHRGG